jgi:hypothetical protein
VTFDAKRTGEAEVRLDFAERRGHALLSMVGVNKIENLLLSIRKKLVHSVQVNTFLAECNYRDREKSKCTYV